MQLYRTSQTAISSKSKLKTSVANRLISAAGTLALSIALLHSTVVMAGSRSNEMDQVAQNNSEYSSKVAISSSEMTAEMKSKLPSKDNNNIGAFSMEDEARDGFYGDGVYAD